MTNQENIDAANQAAHQVLVSIRREELSRAAPEMLALLRDLEFAATKNYGHVMICPMCSSDEDSGHAADCRVGALLKRMGTP